MGFLRTLARAALRDAAHAVLSRVDAHSPPPTPASTPSTPTSSPSTPTPSSPSTPSSWGGLKPEEDTAFQYTVTQAEASPWQPVEDEGAVEARVETRVISDADRSLFEEWLASRVAPTAATKVEPRPTSLPAAIRAMLDAAPPRPLPIPPAPNTEGMSVQAMTQALQTWDNARFPLEATHDTLRALATSAGMIGGSANHALVELRTRLRPLLNPDLPIDAIVGLDIGSGLPHMRTVGPIAPLRMFPLASEVGRNLIQSTPVPDSDVVEAMAKHGWYAYGVEFGYVIWVGFVPLARDAADVDVVRALLPAPPYDVASPWTLLAGRVPFIATWGKGKLEG